MTLSQTDSRRASDERSPLLEAENTPQEDVGVQSLADDSSSADDGSSDEHLLSDGRPPSEAINLADSGAAASKSLWHLVLLTLSIGGLQIVWSVELSNGSPYLLSLGMSKALLAMVWLAGPLTGVLVQPYIGIRSDRCRVSWGKRKPFMVAGTLGTVASSMILAYARDIVRVIGGLGTGAQYGGGYQTATIILAVVMMWCLDFSINTGMCSSIGRARACSNMEQCKQLFGRSLSTTLHLISRSRPMPGRHA
jgi:solute carrier family 45 protein 1/2/4